jgi:hypothetical protein
MLTESVTRDSDLPRYHDRRATVQRLAWLGVALVASALFAFSTVAVFVYQADYFTIAGESAAYRFFLVDRFMHGDRSNLFLPQGYLTSLLHNVVYILVVPSGNIRDQLREVVNLWGHVYTAGVCLLVAAVMVYALVRPALPSLAKAGVVVAALGAEFCTVKAGFYYSYLPDYYLLNMALAPCITLAFLWVRWRSAEPSRLVSGVLLGALVGLTASNKVSILPLAMLPVVLFVARDLRRPALALLDAVVSGCAAIVAFVLVHLLLYRFNIDMIRRVLPLWLEVVFNPGGEASFWEQFVNTYLYEFNYLYIYLLLFIALLLAAVVLVRQTIQRVGTLASWLAYLAILGVALFSLYAIVKRPAGTTAFEGSTIAFALIGCLVGLEARDRLQALGGWIVVGAIALLALTTFPVRHHLLTLADTRPRADDIWALHAKIMATGRPAVVVIPDNSYGFGSVEEGLMKGFSAYPTWVIREGRDGLDRYAPGMTFREAGSTPKLNDPYPTNMTLVVFERRDLGPTAEKYPALNAAMANMACEMVNIASVNGATVCQPRS